MPLIQPSVAPLPSTLDLSGQTVVVTGASAGLGLGICHQLLLHHVSTLVMAVRNITKGEEVKTKLLAQSDVQEANPDVTIDVMAVDTASYASTSQFAKNFSARYTRLDILMLNAGIGSYKRELTVDGHESTVQVNFLSNVLLLFDLLPVLEATAAETGRASRVSFTGSRTYEMAGIKNKDFGADQSVIGHLDLPKTFSSFKQYANSKLLVALFVQEVGTRYKSDKIIVNNFCPGLVKTGMMDALPVYLRVLVDAVKAMRARSVETGASIALHAACVAGEETHGKFLADKGIYRYVCIAVDILY